MLTYTCHSQESTLVSTRKCLIGCEGTPPQIHHLHLVIKEHIADVGLKLFCGIVPVEVPHKHLTGCGGSQAVILSCVPPSVNPAEMGDWIW